jgi:hypothetical protein
MPTMTRWGMRYDHCSLWAWGNHPLADAATHKARQLAHVAFDRIWSMDQTATPREIRDRRSAAYQELAELMGMDPKDCHIKKMSLEQATKVVELMEKKNGRS